MHGLLPVLMIGMVVFLLVAGGAKGKVKSLKDDDSKRYVRRRLMTAREFEFFGSLRAALPEAVIHSQVAMAALIDVEGGKRAARNSFDRKIFDFVVCRADGDVLYVIELDDKSHGSANARRRDSVKDSIAGAVGLRVVRYRSASIDSAVLRRDFDSLSALAVNNRGVGAAWQ
jgi:very-short-patch-repair endonuclease